MIQLPFPETLASLAARVARDLDAKLSVLGSRSPAPGYEIKGDGQTLITHLSSADEAGPGALCFAINQEFMIRAKNAGAIALILPSNIVSDKLPAIVTRDPRLFFAAILEIASPAKIPAPVKGETFFKDPDSVELGKGVIIGHGTYIGAKVKIGQGTQIGPQAFIEDNVTIGSDCLIHPRAILRWGTKIGARCQIHSGAVIGEDGFGYNQVPDPETKRLIHYKNPHLGGVSLGDDVEIGALATIDRGLISDTVIGTGTKIDNLVQIGHNCHIGQDCIIVSQVGAAGHSQVGDRVFILGQAGLTHGAVIGADAIIGGQSGVIGSVPPGRKLWMGTPIQSQQEEYRGRIMVNRDLPKWRRFIMLFKKAKTFAELKEAFNSEENKKTEDKDLSPKF